jgi:hypothetical protein
VLSSHYKLIAFVLLFAGLTFAQAAPQTPQVKVNYLNVCTPSDADQHEIAAALARVPARPQFAPDFEVARGRSTMDPSSIIAGSGAQMQDSGTPPISRWVRIRREYPAASPFSNASGYGLKSDFLAKDFVLLADKNPGRKDGQDATLPSPDDPPLKRAIGNSRNHGRAGQNVLFGDMHWEFRDTPYCGVGGDNIYTAAAESPILTGPPPEPQVHGVLGRGYAPAWQMDSYLVPTDSD